MAEHPWMIFITLVIMFLLSARARGINQAASANKFGLVVEACKYMEDKDILLMMPHFDVKTCISVLHSDNRSTTAKDYGDLVLIALDTLSQRIGEVAVKVSKVTYGHPIRNWTELNLQYCVADDATFSASK